MLNPDVSMKKYDSNKPLIYLHIPKTAGASVKEIFKRWYGSGLLEHYYNESTGSMPEKYEIMEIQGQYHPVCLYGHFNWKRGFGVQDYYPDVDQFITILRDPFESAVSGYFYTRRAGAAWKDQSRISKGDLRNHLLNSKGSLLNHLPASIAMDNYRQVIETSFIEIGVTEYLDESLQRIAKKLDKQYTTGSVARLNISERDQEIPYDLKEEFIEQRPLVYAIYNYVLNKYIS
jgi:hypothetical protein